MVAANSQKCTIGQFINLVNATGWKLVSIGSSKNTMCLILFDPVAI
jgi:hypothetical protein